LHHPIDVDQPRARALRVSLKSPASLGLKSKRRAHPFADALVVVFRQPFSGSRSATAYF
jgi:hypothetical protein